MRLRVARLEGPAPRPRERSGASEPFPEERPPLEGAWESMTKKLRGDGNAGRVRAGRRERRVHGRVVGGGVEGNEDGCRARDDQLAERWCRLCSSA